MPSTKKKTKETTVKVETITVEEQFQEIIKFLRDYDTHMREVARDPLKQALFGGGGAIIGTIVLTFLLGKRLGAWGGVIGAIVGSFVGYGKTNEYDGQVEKLAALPQISQKPLVDSICKILKEKGKLESMIVLKEKGTMEKVFFEVSKERIARVKIWEACTEVLKDVEQVPDTKKNN